MTLITVHGMRRSGNHAVIRWIRRGLSLGSVFLNDCRPGDPYQTFAHLETPEGDVHGGSFRDTRWFAQFPANRGRPHVVSYEDMAPEETGDPAGFAAPTARVIVWRSFPNWLASFQSLTGRQRGTRWGFDHPAQIRTVLPLYAALLEPRRGHLHLHYEGWRGQPGYRAQMGARLGISDKGLPGGAEAYGGGSSFAGGDPSRRWAAMAGDDDYRRLIAAALTDRRIARAIARMDPGAIPLMERIAGSDTAMQGVSIVPRNQ